MVHKAEKIITEHGHILSSDFTVIPSRCHQVKSIQEKRTIKQGESQCCQKGCIASELPVEPEQLEKCSTGEMDAGCCRGPLLPPVLCSVSQTALSPGMLLHLDAIVVQAVPVSWCSRVSTDCRWPERSARRRWGCPALAWGLLRDAAFIVPGDDCGTDSTAHPGLGPWSGSWPPRVTDNLRPVLARFDLQSSTFATFNTSNSTVRDALSWLQDGEECPVALLHGHWGKSTCWGGASLQHIINRPSQHFWPQSDQTQAPVPLPMLRDCRENVLADCQDTAHPKPLHRSRPGGTNRHLNGQSQRVKQQISRDGSVKQSFKRGGGCSWLSGDEWQACGSHNGSSAHPGNRQGNQISQQKQRSWNHAFV